MTPRGGAFSHHLSTPTVETLAIEPVTPQSRATTPCALASDPVPSSRRETRRNPEDEAAMAGTMRRRRGTAAVSPSAVEATGRQLWCVEQQDGAELWVVTDAHNEVIVSTTLYPSDDGVESLERLGKIAFGDDVESLHTPPLLSVLPGGSPASSSPPLEPPALRVVPGSSRRVLPSRSASRASFSA